MMGLATDAVNRLEASIKMKNGARRSAEPEVWGAAEAADHLGVSQSNLRVLRGLPEPYDKLRSGTLWRAAEIRQLAAQRADAA